MKTNNFTKKVLFYLCSVCGNLIIKLNDSGLVPQCCGRDMILLEPGTTDASEEYHVPIWKMKGCKVMVEVGREYHPMTEMHYIQWIVVETNRGFYCKHLWPNMVPEACFRLCSEEYVTDVYAYCNLHKLWKAEPVDAPDSEE